MLTSKMIKEAALAAGADLCGIGSMDRFDNAPELFNPQKLFPEAKSIICLAFRIPRGVQREIEEGTSYHHYTTMAIEVLDETIMPMMALRCARIIEEEGYVALLPHNPYIFIIQQ